VFRITPLWRADLERTLDRARAAQPTYAAVGATQSFEFPNGFRHDRHELVLGDASVFERAREGLSRWQAHVGAGAKVHPGNSVEEDETVLVLIGSGPVQIVAPCRIVYVIDEADRFGLGYGTLPGHPECGEESFVIERGAAGTVFRVTAFSRPTGLLSRAGAPVARSVQLHFTDRYLRALARYVGGEAAD
jgi:uncharacterized protein (UPF0548 family)